MRLFTVLSSVLILGVALLWGTGELRAEETAFRFQLELAKSKARNAREPLPMPTAHVERLTYAEGYAKSMKDGKPLLVRVNDFRCQAACETCKGCIFADAAECGGDSTPRLILAYPSEGRLLKATEWRTIPTAAAVQNEAAKYSGVGVKCKDCPVGQCEAGNCPNCPNGCVAAPAKTPTRMTFSAPGCSSGR